MVLLCIIEDEREDVEMGGACRMRERNVKLDMLYPNVASPTGGRRHLPFKRDLMGFSLSLSYPNVKDHAGKPSCKWEDNIKTDLKEIDCELNSCVSRDSAVGIATGYGLDD
jgi:hypothetical protein